MRRFPASAACLAALLISGVCLADPPRFFTVSPLGLEMVLVTRAAGPFYMSRFEVTQEQWHRVMRTNPSRRGMRAECPVGRIALGEIPLFSPAPGS